MASLHYRFRVPDHVADLVRHLHPQLKKKVKASLKIIRDDPYAGKALKAELAGLGSFRIGRVRIVYRLLASERIIEIVVIGPRKTIYEETLRLVAQDD